MKAIRNVPVWIGLFTFALTGVAQDNSSAAATNAPPPSAAVSEAAATPPPSAAAEPSAPAEGSAVIPLIQYVDVPVTTAIENLARQAGLNYIIDPKVPFGQVDPATGKVMPQPTLSIRWEKLTAEQALTAVLNNFNLQIVEDPKARIARITVKDPAAPPPLVTKIIQLKYAGTSNLVAAVQTIFSDKRSRVLGDVRTSQLVITATEGEMNSVDELVMRLDTATRQVLIEARLIEVSQNPQTSKGIDWSGTLQNQHVTFGNGTSTANTLTTYPGVPTTTTLPGGRTTTTTPSSSSATLVNTIFNGDTSGLKPAGVSLNTLKGFTPPIGFLSADGASAVLSFFNQDSDATVLSTPRAVTLDNQEAVLSVIRAQPIFNTTAGTQGSPGGSQVLYTNLGTILHVTPRVAANDYVNLRVIPEVSSLGGTSTKIVAGVVNQADIFDIRSVKTEVMIPSGNTLVLGGLLSDDQSKGFTKVPLLGDIPLLGFAFRSENKQRLKKNLIVFITPTIIKDTDYQPTQTDFLKTKIPEDESNTDWDKPWNSAKPKDWSKTPPTYDESLVTPQPAQ